MALRSLRKLPKRVLSGLVPAPVSEGSDSDSVDSDSVDSDSVDSDSVDSDSVSSDGVDAGAAEPEMVLAGEVVDAFLAKHCQAVTSWEAGRLARQLLERLDPEGQDGFDPEAFERRGMTHSTDAGGMVVGRFQ